jgi:hypothetical protein
MRGRLITASVSIGSPGRRAADRPRTRPGGADDDLDPVLGKQAGHLLGDAAAEDLQRRVLRGDDGEPRVLDPRLGQDRSPSRASS